MQPIPVVLSAADVAWCVETGRKTHHEFVDRTGFYRNLLSSHVIGKFGERAAEAWLEREVVGRGSIVSHFRDWAELRRCDIEITEPASLRIEVKTWNANFWARWGRCVQPGQLPKLRLQADVVLWARLAEHASDAVVEGRAPGPITVLIIGHSTVDDVANAPLRNTGPTGKTIQNHQLDEGDIRRAEALLRLRAAP